MLHLRALFATMALLILVSMISCGGNGIPNLPPDENPDNYKFVASDQPRDENPAVPPGDLSEVVGGNTDFACDLYQVLANGDENIFFSPFSISQALAMTYAGARGSTETQIADTMHFTVGQDRLHPAFNRLDLDLQSRGEGAKGKDGEGFRLNIANSTWGQDGWTWQEPFLDTLGVNYGAGMRLVDFLTQPEQCRLTINAWVEDRTEDRIRELLPEGVISSDTVLVLVNVIYFNAAWLEPFEEEYTHNGDFTLLDDSVVGVPLMEQTEEHDYTEGDGFKAVQIMYDGEELSMVIILPDVGRFDEIESSLSTEFIDGIIGDFGNYSVTLTLPKFEYESEFGLAETLYDMGMEDAFVPGVADFSGMDGSYLLFITDVIHKAFVSVDEAGTEAAAATGVVIGYTAMPESATFKADHPFIFFIRDIETESILFVGRVLDPRSQQV
jgi:serpin B